MLSNEKHCNKTKYSAADIKGFIDRATEANGGVVPGHMDYIRIAKELGFTPKVVSWNRNRCGDGTYSGLLRFLGVEPSPRSGEDRAAIFLNRLGLIYRSEFPLEVDGRRYRIDFQIEYKGHSVFLEIDGNSHYSTVGANERIAAQKGLTAEEVFLQKKSRDSVVEQYAKSVGVPLLRMFTHEITNGLSEDTFFHRLDMAIATSPRTHSRVASKELIEELGRYLTYRQIMQYLNVSEPTYQKMRDSLKFCTPPTMKEPMPDWLLAEFPEGNDDNKFNRNRYWYSAQGRVELIALRKTMTTVEIAKHIGVSKNTVTNLVKHHKLQGVAL